MLSLNRIDPDQVREAYRNTRAAEEYARKHRRTWLRRLASRRESHLVVRALSEAGARGPLLDSPCGTGRFLPVLSALGPAAAVDASVPMLTRARGAFHGNTICFLNAALPRLPFQDRVFGATVCLRFLHHLHDDEDRLASLAELRRVCEGPIVISLFLSGNYQALRRRRKDRTRGESRRFILDRPHLDALAARAGLEVLRSRSLLPGVSALHVVSLRPGSSA